MWRERIDKLEAEPLNFALYEAASEDAGHWDRCGIGERREVLEAKGVRFVKKPLIDEAYPEESDGVLYDLGMQFNCAIDDKDWETAREILDAMDGWIACHPTVKTKEASPSSKPMSAA